MISTSSPLARLRRVFSNRPIRCLAALLVLFNAIIVASPIQAGLVNYWDWNNTRADTAGSFAGNTSTSATDFSAGSSVFLTLTALNAGPSARTGVGQIVINTNDALMQAGVVNTADNQLLTQWTVAFWANKIRTDGVFDDMFQDTRGNNVNNLRLAGTTGLALQLNSSSSSPYTFAPAPALNEWYFLTIVQDIATWSIYKNGVLLQTAATTRTGPTAGLNRQFQLGSDTRPTRRGDVLYANMSVWDNSITASQVTTLFNGDGDPNSLLNAAVVPEPVTFVLAGLGFLGMAGVAVRLWNKRRRNG